MSKEQTPIEELELRLNVMSSQEFIDWIRIEGLSKLKSSQDTKVLEALEREVIKARVSKDIAIKEKVLKHIVSEEVLDKYISDAQKYYETEVKPKYE